jgi:hypothetical protein
MPTLLFIALVLEKRGRRRWPPSRQSAAYPGQQRSGSGERQPSVSSPGHERANGERNGMVYLDCETYESALTSLAAAIRVRADQLLEAIHQHDLDPPAAYEDVYTAGPRNILATLGVDINAVTFEGVNYFHGTRVIDPSSFKRDGILPLSAMLDRLWATLYELVSDRITRKQWDLLRQRLTDGQSDDEDAAWHYTNKLSSLTQNGPFASLICDLVRRPVFGSSYLVTPEMVDHIARHVGLGLQQRFEAATTSCIVKFRVSAGGDPGVAGAALSYIASRARGEELDWSSHSGFDGCNRAVPPEAVVAIEELPRLSRSGETYNRLYASS